MPQLYYRNTIIFEEVVFYSVTYEVVRQQNFTKHHYLYMLVVIMYQKDHIRKAEN